MLNKVVPIDYSSRHVSASILTVFSDVVSFEWRSDVYAATTFSPSCESFKQRKHR